jgi:hypothetical protein
MMKIGSLLYLPIIFAGAYLIVNRRYLGGFVLYALGFAMTVYQHHIQMIYYGYLCLLIFGFWYLIEWIKTKEYKRLGTVVLLVVLGSALGITSNLARMWTTYEISDESIRGANILEPVDATDQASETEPDEEYSDIRASIPSGDDLSRSKKPYPPTDGGDNPMALEQKLKSKLAAALAEKKAKPDYIDIDGDGDTKEPMKKAAKDKKQKRAK